MARKPRFGLSAVPQHVIQRGNNREPCFFAEADYQFYRECIRDAAERYRCVIHAYVLMTNHVHLLVTPDDAGSISRLIQSVGRHYVTYINHRYGKSGTLWEGRHKTIQISRQWEFRNPLVVALRLSYSDAQGWRKVGRSPNSVD